MHPNYAFNSLHFLMINFFLLFFFFFFNDTATTEIYPLSLHDALPISRHAHARFRAARHVRWAARAPGQDPAAAARGAGGGAFFRRCERRHPARRAGPRGGHRRDRAGGDAGTLARTMEVRPEILALVLGCALVTAVPRVLPLVALSRLQLPPWLADWLRYVPIAVLAALLAIELPSAGAPRPPAVMAGVAGAGPPRRPPGAGGAGGAGSLLPKLGGGPLPPHPFP